MNIPFLRPAPRAKGPSAPAKPPRAATVKALRLDGVPAPLELRLSPRARRMSLRIDSTREVVLVVAPLGVPDGDVLRFVGRHVAWVRAKLSAVPPRLPFEDGIEIPILGVPHRIRHDPDHRGAARMVATGWGNELRVGGSPEFLARRVEQFLKGEARKMLAARARAKAAMIGARVTGVTVRDTKSRWGSCSATGGLSFSWRLILAPDPVFDYVVAHEVAHLKEMNHSIRFWRLCAKLTHNAEGARAWLKAHGARLHRYG